MVQSLKDPKFPPETWVSVHPYAYLDYTEDMSSLQSLTLALSPFSPIALSLLSWRGWLQGLLVDPLIGKEPNFTPSFIS